MNEKKYIPRLIDKKIDDCLSVFGAICIEGPKWCGKTLTSLNHSKSFVYLDDEDIKNRAQTDPKSIFYSNDKIPELIDEWHLVPSIWDAVRREVDNRTTKGNFILTGSTTLKNFVSINKINHSGTGRIAKMKMYTMSLFESGDSSGKASIMDMYNGIQKSMNLEEFNLKDIATLIIRGGWPENIKVVPEKAHLIPNYYISSILDSDMNDEQDRKRDKNKMKMLLRSLARNESTIVSNQTILKDIEENFDDIIASKNTLKEYLDVLERLHLIENQEAFGINLRSSSRVGKSAKRHLTDPSLSCACLDLNVEKLMNDLNTFGFMYEALVERDLRIYADYLNGHLYHFRDNISGLEVDSILEFADGEYCAIEIKLGYNQIEEAKKNLLKFYNNVNKKPKFMCIIIGNTTGISYDKETNIYTLPITALKP